MKQYLALIYDYWRSTRIFFAGTLLLGIFFIVSIYMDFLLLGRPEGRGLSLVIENTYNYLGVVQLLWLTILLIGIDSNNDLKLTLPRYLLRLPISAWKLAAARMSYGIFTNILLGLLFTSIYYVLFAAKMEKAFPSIVITFLIIWPVSYAIYQAIVWCIGSAGFTATFAALAFGYFLTYNVFDFNEMDISNIPLSSFVVVILLSYIVSVAAITQQRKSRFSHFNLSSIFKRAKPSQETLPLETFASKEEALRWLEYQQQWKYFPRILIILSLAIACGLYTDYIQSRYDFGYKITSDWVEIVNILQLSAYGAFNGAMIVITGVCLYRYSQQF